MEYDAVMEYKANTQDERMIELEASVDAQTVLTDTTDYAKIAVAKGNNKELNKIKAMMKQLVDSVTAQAVTVAALSTNMNVGSIGTKKTTDKNKMRPGLHMYAHYKCKVYHKERNCLELDANNVKRYPGWKSVFTKK